MIAMDLAFVLEDAGAEVVGPYGALEPALRAIGTSEICAAILDLRLGTDGTEPVARALSARAVPFLFYSGQALGAAAREEWPDARLVAKPARAEAVVAALAGLMAA